MSDPLILVLKTDPDRAVAYACPDCHNVIQAANDNPDIDAAARKHAAEHCIFHCEKCGVRLIKKPGPEQNYPGWGMKCNQCDEQWKRDAYQRRFDAAEKLTEQQFNERTDLDPVVYLEGEDRFFPEGIDELREWWCEFHYDAAKPDEMPDFPEYVFTCTSITGVRLDADSILESALDEHHEDAIENVDVAALQKHLDEWSADPANQVTSWESNHRLLVLLSDEENAKFLEKWRGET
jgi:hypothetical protein